MMSHLVREFLLKYILKNLSYSSLIGNVTLPLCFIILQSYCNFITFPHSGMDQCNIEEIGNVSLAIPLQFISGKGTHHLP